MLNKLFRHLGCTFISYAALFTPVLASAEDGSNTGGYCGGGFVVGALITGAILLSMSSNKKKADKADDFISGNLDLQVREDVYSHTNTTSRKISKNDD